MFRPLRHLKISLAAKCQLLFGLAVLLIIAAALFVPWQRMEQLTEQINERAASALCDDEIADHAIDGRPVWSRSATTKPSDGAVTAPMEVRARERVANPVLRPITPPQLILLNLSNSGKNLTSFERRAIKYFQDNPSSLYYSRTSRADDGPQPHYRYCRVLRGDSICAQCHASGRSPEAFADGPVSRPTTRPTTSGATLIGLVSLDMKSQVDINQLLLNRIFILTAGSLAGTLAIVVFYLITTRLILQPVHVLQETAEKVSKGDLNIRSHISTGDEFETLSKTFNVMLANLKASEDQLRSINKSLDLKLGQLAESNVALYESNRLKSEFLANVSHELRTPLNSILGFADLLKETINGDVRTTRYVQNILLSGRNLLELINDLLDLAKIEAGRMEVRSEPLSLTDLFEGLASIIKPLTEKQQLTIQTVVAKDVPILATDGPKLQQVLYNFLSNAIKFSPAGGRIDLAAELADEDHVRLTVTDQGSGIDPAQHQVIFEKFRQLDGSVTRQHSGTGLGLAISRELIVLLGGTIGVISAPGSGAMFWVNIPLKTAPGEQDVRTRMVLT